MRRHVLAVVLGAAPAALVVTAFAEDRKVLIIAPPIDAGVADVQPDVDTFAPSTNLPDPPPVVSREQWVWGLRWSKGDVYLLGVQPWDVGAPRATPRVIGRFAIELWEGKTLVERVRFDFPGLGVPDTDGGHFAPPSFERGLTTRIGVIFPAVKRGTRAELIDRATDQRWILPWPPNTSSADGG
jgi:hypothetical protein